MGRIISIVSGKGGVGKTTICATLGLALSQYLKKSVCVVDADFALNNLDVVLGLENRVVYDILDVIKGKCRPVQAVIENPNVSNFYLLPSVKHENLNLIRKDDFDSLILSLSSVFDYVLIDSSAGIDFSFNRAISPCNEALVVVTPSISSLRDASKVIDKLYSNKKDNVRLVVNRLRGDLVRSGEMISPEEISEVLDVRLAGVVPESDELLALSELNNLDYALGKETREALLLIAKNIDLNLDLKCDYLKKFRGVFSSIKKFLKE